MLAAGLPIGKSLAEPDQVDQARAVMDAMRARGVEVPIPVDVVVATSFAADARATVKDAADVGPDDLILDIGPRTAAALAYQLRRAGVFAGNGSSAVFRFESVTHGTRPTAQAIAASDGFFIGGGADILAAIPMFGITVQVGYISTGGGAFL